MKTNSEREKILKLLRNSLLDSDEHVSVMATDEDIFVSKSNDPVMVFAERLSSDGGRFVYCQNEVELFENIKTFLNFYSNISFYYCIILREMFRFHNNYFFNFFFLK